MNKKFLRSLNTAGRGGAPANPPISWTFTTSGNVVDGNTYTGQSGTQTSSSGGLADGVTSDTLSSAWGDGINNPSQIIADFGSTKTVTTIRLAGISPWGSGYLNTLATLAYSTNGTDWTTITTVTGLTAGVVSTFNANVNARYIRLQRPGIACNCSEFWFT